MIPLFSYLFISPSVPFSSIYFGLCSYSSCIWGATATSRRSGPWSHWSECFGGPLVQLPAPQFRPSIDHLNPTRPGAPYPPRCFTRTHINTQSRMVAQFINQLSRLFLPDICQPLELLAGPSLSLIVSFSPLFSCRRCLMLSFKKRRKKNISFWFFVDRRRCLANARIPPTDGAHHENRTTRSVETITCLCFVRACIQLPNEFRLTKAFVHSMTCARLLFSHYCCWTSTDSQMAGPTKMKRGLLQPGQERSMPALSLKLLLPPTDYYITYEGSATTPACQETATWILFNRPLYITEQQVLSPVGSRRSSIQSQLISTCLLSFYATTVVRLERLEAGQSQPESDIQ